MFDHILSLGRTLPQALQPDAASRMSDLADIRRIYESLFGGLGRVPSGCLAEPGTLGGVPGEWIRLNNHPRGRLILYFHGGGYVAGSPATHRGLIARLAKVADCHAFAPDYRLAPEYPFPAAVRDGLDVYRHAVGDGFRPGSVVLAGDGAGGGLALSVLLAIRNAALPMPAALVAMSPWADLTLSGWSMLKNRASDRQHSWSDLFVCARHYLGAASPGDIYASPLFASFRGFPPVTVHAGSLELLRDDASRIGDQAEAAGVPVDIEIYDGQGHLFQAGVHNKAGCASLQRLGHFIRAQLALDGGYRPNHGAAVGDAALI